MRPFVTKKKKKGKSKHFPYKKQIKALCPKTSSGIVKWVSDDLSYAPAATTGGLTFYLNSYNDPGAALSAVKPQWYTEVSSIWKKYKVYSCKWHVHMSNTTADQVQGGYCMTAAAEIPPDTAAGLTECIQKGHPFWIGATDENLSNHIDLEGTWSLKKNITKHDVIGDYYTTNMDTDPSETWACHITLGSAANISIKYRITMEMFVVVYNYQQNAPD